MMNDNDMNRSYDTNHQYDSMQSRILNNGNLAPSNVTNGNQFLDHRQSNWGHFNNQTNWGIRMDEYPPSGGNPPNTANQPSMGTIQPSMSTNQVPMGVSVNNGRCDNAPNGMGQIRQFPVREPMMNTTPISNVHDQQPISNHAMDRSLQDNQGYTPRFNGNSNQEPQPYDDNQFWAKNNNTRRGQVSNRRGRSQRGRGFRRGGTGRKPKQEREDGYSSPWRYPITRDTNDETANKEGYWKPKVNTSTTGSNMPIYWETQLKIMKARTWKFHEKFQAHLWTINPVIIAGVKPTANIVKDKLVDIIKEFLLEQDLVEVENEVYAVESEEGSDLESSLDFLKDRLSN